MKMFIKSCTIRITNIPIFYLVKSLPFFRIIRNNNDTTVTLMVKVDYTQYWIRNIHNKFLLLTQLGCVCNLCQSSSDNIYSRILMSYLKFMELLVTNVVGYILHHEQNHSPEI